VAGKRVGVDDFYPMTVISRTNTCLCPDKDTSWPQGPHMWRGFIYGQPHFPTAGISSVYCHTKLLIWFEVTVFAQLDFCLLGVWEPVSIYILSLLVAYLPGLFHWISDQMVSMKFYA